MTGSEAVAVAGITSCEVGLSYTQMLEKLKDTFLYWKLYLCSYSDTSLSSCWSIVDGSLGTSFGPVKLISTPSWTSMGSAWPLNPPGSSYPGQLR